MNCFVHLCLALLFKPSEALKLHFSFILSFFNSFLRCFAYCSKSHVWCCVGVSRVSALYSGPAPCPLYVQLFWEERDSLQTGLSHTLTRVLGLLPTQYLSLSLSRACMRFCPQYSLPWPLNNGNWTEIQFPFFPKREKINQVEDRTRYLLESVVHTQRMPLSLWISIKHC